MDLTDIYREVSGDTDAVEQLHTEVINYLEENGPAHNHDLKEEIDLEDVEWEESYLVRVLSELRRQLAEEGYIEVEEQEPESGETPRKLWILPGHEAEAGA